MENVSLQKEIMYESKVHIAYMTVGLFSTSTAMRYPVRLQLAEVPFKTFRIMEMSTAKDKTKYNVY